jgi:hypothetical protein
MVVLTTAGILLHCFCPQYISRFTAARSDRVAGSLYRFAGCKTLVSRFHGGVEFAAHLATLRDRAIYYATITIRFCGPRSPDC